MKNLKKTQSSLDVEFISAGNTLPKERTRNFAIRILGPTFDERHIQNY